MKLKEAINIQIIKQPLDTLKVCVPSMVYVVQNNLLYVAASHLDAATYQVPWEKAIYRKQIVSTISLSFSLGHIPVKNSHRCPLYSGYIETAVDSYPMDSIGSVAGWCCYGTEKLAFTST